VEFEELNVLFDSPTIKPTFDLVHIILALFIFEKHADGLGRYRLEKELLIGSGTVKSLVTKLKKDIHFITTVGNNNKRKGHVLTEKGLKYLSKIKKRIPILEESDISVLKSVLIKSENVHTYFCQLKNAADKITNGMAQRDAAIKVGGIGATCLVYDGVRLLFKHGTISEEERNQMKINDDVQTYFTDSFNLKLENNDLIIIGLADDPIKARLVALNAALTLL